MAKLGQTDHQLLEIVQASIDSGDHAKDLLEQLREAGYLIVRDTLRRAGGQDLRAAGGALVLAADAKFTTGVRCAQCGFQAEYHSPADHAFARPPDPFVVALKEFVEAATGMLSTPNREEGK